MIPNLAPESSVDVLWVCIATSASMSGRAGVQPGHPEELVTLVGVRLVVGHLVGFEEDDLVLGDGVGVGEEPFTDDPAIDVVTYTFGQDRHPSRIQPEQVRPVPGPVRVAVHEDVELGRTSRSPVEAPIHGSSSTANVGVPNRSPGRPARNC